VIDLEYEPGSLLDPPPPGRVREFEHLQGESNEHRHVYYITGERGLYLQRLQELEAAEYLEQVSIWYAEPWQVLASAARVHLSE
jgi:hypothetical protein